MSLKSSSVWNMLSASSGYLVMGIMSVILVLFFLSEPSDPIISDKEDLADLMENSPRFTYNAHILAEQRKRIAFEGKLSGKYSLRKEVMGTESYISSMFTLHFDDRYKKLYSSLDITWKDGTKDHYKGESLYTIKGSHISLKRLSGSRNFAPVTGISIQYVDENEFMLIEPDGKSFKDYLFVKNEEKG